MGQRLAWLPRAGAEEVGQGLQVREVEGLSDLRDWAFANPEVDAALLVEAFQVAEISISQGL
jgi:hypothetical protein